MMKRYVLFAIVALIFSRCSNDDIDPTKITTSKILGKWSVKTDSLNFGGIVHNYSSSTSDYYDFQSSGLLVIHEGGQLDTAQFTIVSDSVNLKFKNPGTLTTVVNNGSLESAIINNYRFSRDFAVTVFSINEIKISKSFTYTIKGWSGANESGGSPTVYVPVTVVTNLMK
jgi:hypothetical protein